MAIKYGVCIQLVETDSIEALTSDQVDSLDCGDTVVKVDADGKHAYRVSLKKDKEVLCLTYADADRVETITYDFNAETKQWEYNAKSSASIDLLEGLGRHHRDDLRPVAYELPDR